MTPNLPESPVKAVLADRNISNGALNKLKEYGIQVFFSMKLPDITDSTATHPDMQFVPIGEKRHLFAVTLILNTKSFYLITYCCLYMVFIHHIRTTVCLI